MKSLYRELGNLEGATDSMFRHLKGNILNLHHIWDFTD